MHKFLSNRRLNLALFMLVIAVCYSVGLSAQRVSEKNVSVIAGKNDVLIDQIFNKIGNIEVALSSPEFTVGLNQPTGKVFVSSNASISGLKQFTIEYKTLFNTDTISNYRIYNINFSKSLVKAYDDVLRWDGTDTLDIDVKANDTYSYSGSTLKINQTSGNAEVVDGKIQYSNPTFEGPDYIHYTLTDSLGVSDYAIVKIEAAIAAPTANESHKFTLNYLAVKEISVPDNSTIDIEPYNGSLTLTSANHYIYVPAEEVGQDSFKFEKNGFTITYYVTIIDVQKDPGIVKNDVVYVPKNSTVAFDVFKNDLAQNLTIDTFSQQLGHSTQGNFTYASNNAEGVKNFWYKASSAVGQETGKIKINVGNFVPNQDIPYVFDVLKNQSLTIEYNVPIGGYSFTLDPTQPPLYGSVSIVNDSIALSCGKSYGKVIINYTPSSGWTGADEFVLNYCINGTQFTPIKIIVNTYDTTLSGCPCIDDCVYKGDLNGDGRVDKEDLLVLGRYLGHSGPQRTGLGVAANIGENAGAWETTSVYQSDLKHADANGDGVLTGDDVQAIHDNYGKTNNLVKKEVLGYKDFPFSITVDPAEADSGDLVTIYYRLGSTTKPANDVYGLSFGLNVDWGDSASVVNEFYQNNWFTDYSPSLSFFKQISDGNFRMAFTRSSGSGISGDGVIGQMSIIVDELDGFREENENYSTRTIVADEIVVEDTEGNKSILDAIGTTIKINKKKKDRFPSADQLIVYPNPGDNVFFLHFNGGNTIQDVILYSNVGSEVVKHTNVNSQSHQVPLAQLPSGIYTLSVRTDNGMVNKRVIKR